MLALMMVPLVALSVSNVAFAQGGLQGGADAAKGDNVASDLMGNGGVFQTVTNILLFIIGAVSVIMLIIGGIRYVVSGGDQSAVTAAKHDPLRYRRYRRRLPGLRCGELRDQPAGCVGLVPFVRHSITALPNARLFLCGGDIPAGYAH